MYKIENVKRWRTERRDDRDDGGFMLGSVGASVSLR